MLWEEVIAFNLLGWMQIVNETIPALQKLKEQGLVRFIGITGYPLDIYTYVLDRYAVCGMLHAADCCTTPCWQGLFLD